MARHTAMLSNEIDNAPPAIALLDVTHRERRHFGPPEAAAQEDRQDRTVAQSFGRGGIRGIQQRLRLPDREPVPQADPL